MAKKSAPFLKQGPNLQAAAARKLSQMNAPAPEKKVKTLGK